MKRGKRNIKKKFGILVTQLMNKNREIKTIKKTNKSIRDRENKRKDKDNRPTKKMLIVRQAENLRS